MKQSILAWMNIITALSEYNQPIFIRISICEKRDWNTTHGQDKFFQRRDRLSNDVFKWNMAASELIFDRVVQVGFPEI